MSLAEYNREIVEENRQLFMEKYGCGIKLQHLEKAGLLPRDTYTNWKNYRTKRGDATMVVIFPDGTSKIKRGSFEAKDGAVTFNSTLEFKTSVFVTGGIRTKKSMRVVEVLPPTCSIYRVDIGKTYRLNLVYGDDVVVPE